MIFIFKKGVVLIVLIAMVIRLPIKLLHAKPPLKGFSVVNMVDRGIVVITIEETRCLTRRFVGKR